MILLKAFKEGQGEAGIVKKLFNLFSYKYIRQGFFLISCFSFNKKTYFLLSSKNSNKSCTGLQTFLYIVFTPLINKFLSFLKIPVSRPFSFYAVCWMLNVFLVRHYKCVLLKQEQNNIAMLFYLNMVLMNRGNKSAS